MRHVMIAFVLPFNIKTSPFYVSRDPRLLVFRLRDSQQTVVVHFPLLGVYKNVVG